MTQSTAPILSGIEHIVVLMLENRSFDNILGWLYDSNNAYPFQQWTDLRWRLREKSDEPMGQDRPAGSRAGTGWLDHRSY
jgi:phospholipase C